MKSKVIFGIIFLIVVSIIVWVSCPLHYLRFPKQTTMPNEFIDKPIRYMSDGESGFISDVYINIGADNRIWVAGYAPVKLDADGNRPGVFVVKNGIYFDVYIKLPTKYSPLKWAPSSFYDMSSFGCHPVGYFEVEKLK